MPSRPKSSSTIIGWASAKGIWADVRARGADALAIPTAVTAATTATAIPAVRPMDDAPIRRRHVLSVVGPASAQASPQPASSAASGAAVRAK